MDPYLDLDQPARFNITCHRGLAPALEAEVRALGHEIESARETGVTIQATLRDAYRLNLCLRTAFHVLYELATFRCHDGDELYDRVRDLPWDRIVPAEGGYLTVVSKANTPSVTNTMYPSLKVKDAIVDQITSVLGIRPDSGPDADGSVVTLHWFGDEVRLYVDTSGRKLADRGYRKRPHTAPLRESLAAAIVLASGYDGTQALVNPMCGSGTLAIEAALIGSGRAPGLLRAGGFAFQHLIGYDPAVFKEIRAEVSGQSKTPGLIVVTDIDPDAIDAARHNAETAGVAQLIDFECCDFAETVVPDVDEAGGIVLVNPEYGERLSQGEEEALAETYNRFGDFLKQECPGYQAWLLTGNRHLAKKVGLRASKKQTLFNGSIECRLLRYDLYRGSKKQRKQPGAEVSEPQGAPGEAPAPQDAS
ncbi:MAG: class I SAM-dependent RNA methyltransferase [Planctomycetes bacterium]|nr:class I SAM-dependent RNA methyltransferase [Planctomycetota bacterium]